MEFNPLLAFCEMHHDRLIEGTNPFGPAGAGGKCEYFLWSKQDLPKYFVPRSNGPHIELERIPGKVGDYYLYAKPPHAEEKE